MDLGKASGGDTIKTDSKPSCRARPDSQGTLPGGIISTSVQSHLASDDSCTWAGAWECRNGKGRLRPCGCIGAIDKHEVVVVTASQVPVPDQDDDLNVCGGCSSGDESNATVLCGTPRSDVSALHDKANSMYAAHLDPESPEYVNQYSSQWRKVTARERSSAHDVRSRKTGTRWRPMGCIPVGSVGDVEGLQFFKRPPFPV